MSPVRYYAPDGLRQDPDGPAVLFADVEPALRDSARLAWLLPIISDEETPAIDARTEALADGMRLGLTGIALVDHAMGLCP